MVDYIFSPQAAIDATTGRLVNESGLSGSVYASEADALAGTDPLTVNVTGGVPTTSISVSNVGQLPGFTIADHYRVWWASGGYIVELLSFDGLLAEVTAAQEAASTAQEAAESLSTGVWRRINGQVPDENGAGTISGLGGGSGVLVLSEGEAVPEGTPANTLIARSASAPPPGVMEVITATATTSSATSASEVSLAVPSAVVAGDLLVAAVTVHSQNGTSTAPAGWVKLQELPTNTSDFRTTTIWGLPVPTSGDVPVGSQLFSWNVGGRVAGAMFRVTGVDLTTPVLANGGVGSRTQGTYSISELLGSAGGLVLTVSVGQVASGATSLPLVYSETVAAFIGLDTGPDAGTSRTVLGVAWATTDIDWPANTVATNDDTANAFGAQVVALRSAA